MNLAAVVCNFPPECRCFTASKNASHSHYVTAVRFETWPRWDSAWWPACSTSPRRAAATWWRRWRTRPSRVAAWREGTTVLNVFSDEEYNRSVITIVARIDVIGEAVLAACERACGLIDMTAHAGIHPCMGSVDLVPFYPLGEKVGLEECATEARALALALTSRVDGTSAFFFGSADVPRNRGLAQRRREMGWFKKVVDMSTIHPDVGPSPQRRYGLTGVGASPYVMNCNVTIDTQDLAVGRKVAAALRESGEAGLPGIQVLALPHEGAVEIACNVKSIPCSSSWAGTVPWPAFSISGRAYHHVPARLITARVAQLAGTHGVAVRGTALVGFTPRECRVLAEWALTLGIGEFWTKQHQLYM
ncbi:formiminotransferase N-terminal subdomain-containing protein isoform X2 [Denticeps clupeoides]|uniref:formiminotransferase N-terminal subdomain-containing protein isoform X2 n=1 Tax=Denticeps clupeoides TaxID=299321 RepID=UPI0010A3D3BE|nr:formiminotransferase N-terminal subdomain-containing protein isoform X2 [Denticeps clupeoides]